MIFDVLANHIIRNVTGTKSCVSNCPKMLPPILLSQLRKFLLYSPRRPPLDALRQLRRRKDRRRGQQQMNMICRHRSSDDRHASGSTSLTYQVAHTLHYPAPENLLPVLRAPDHVVLQVVNRVCALPVFRHPSILAGIWRLKADRLKAVGLNRAMDTKQWRAHSCRRWCFVTNAIAPEPIDLRIDPSQSGLRRLPKRLAIAA